MRFDKDQDTKLSYEEFLLIISPLNIKQKRPNYQTLTKNFMNKYSPLSPQIFIDTESQKSKRFILSSGSRKHFKYNKS